MNWDSISALSGIIGAVAVILSILYLARQVKLSSDLARAESQRELLNTAHLWHPLATTPGLTKDFRSALNRYDSINTDSQARFNHFIHPILNHVEACFRMHRQGLFEDDSYERWMAGLVGIINTPGGAIWWSKTSVMYGPDFVAALEHMQAHSDTTYDIRDVWDFYSESAGG